MYGGYGDIFPACPEGEGGEERGSEKKKEDNWLINSQNVLSYTTIWSR